MAKAIKEGTFFGIELGNRTNLHHQQGANFLNQIGSQAEALVNFPELERSQETESSTITHHFQLKHFALNDYKIF